MGAVRLAGRISEWNDEKGFGFVMPNGGGDRAFVHISAFQRGSRRPVSGDLISYLPHPDARGRLQAREVRHAGERIEAPRKPSAVPRAGIGVIALVAAIVAAFFGLIPMELSVVYLAASVITYLLYYSDKHAARRGASRTPESSLHTAALLGGWPGALIAQQQFRHKTIKQPFQSLFWLTVLINLAAVMWLIGSGTADELIRVLHR